VSPRAEESTREGVIGQGSSVERDELDGGDEGDSGVIGRNDEEEEDWQEGPPEDAPTQESAESGVSPRAAESTREGDGLGRGDEEDSEVFDSEEEDDWRE
jgi:hypothetical protein